MCGRYALHSNPHVLALQFGLGQLPEFAPRYNITPSASVPVVRQLAEEGRVAQLCLWGLRPKWLKDHREGFINAKAETVHQKPAFREAFKRRRCLVPADGFYEWRQVEHGKQPYYVRPRDAEIFGFAGLIEDWENEQGERVASFAIITAPANQAMRPIHERMPAIIRPEDYDAWLGAERVSPEALRGLMLKPYPSLSMLTYPVSTRVNSPKNDDATLTEALDA